MKELVLKSREQITLIFIVITGCFLIFYWTHLAFVSFAANIQSETIAIKEKISKVDLLVKDIKTSNNRLLRVNMSLLAFMQNKTMLLGFEDKLTVIKPKTAVSGKESATMRFEKFTLNDFISLTELIDKYENLQIDSMSVIKRFDNIQLVNISMELSKIK